MDAWIFLSLGAALAQTVRFMLQKQLRATRLSTGGATFARFIYSAPLVALAAFAAACSRAARSRSSASYIA